MTISQIVEKKFKRTKDKSLLFASDFPEYDQDYIGDLLSIYVREGKLVRLANGVYLDDRHQVRPRVPQSNGDSGGHSKA